MNLIFFVFVATLALAGYIGWMISGRIRLFIEEKTKVKCAQKTLEAVLEHYEELHAKKSAMAVDQGYGVIDESKWQNEISAFTSLILIKKIGHISDKAWVIDKYRVFMYDLIKHLLKLPRKPTNFSVQDFVTSSMSDPGFPNTPKMIVSWIFSSLFAALGVSALIEAYWIAGTLSLLAGIVANPHLVSLTAARAPWVAKFNLSLFATLLVASLSSYAGYIQHNQILHEQELLAEKAAREVIEKRQRTALERKAEADRQRIAIEEASKAEFAQRKAEVLKLIQDYIAQEKYSDAKPLFEKFKAVQDIELIALKLTFDTKSADYERRLATAKAEQERQENYAKRITPSALMSYTKDQYPKLFRKYGKRIPEIEKLRRTAAEQVIDSDKCDYVDLAEVSQDSSPVNNVRFFIDCKNGNRFYRTEQEIKKSLRVQSQADLAWNEPKARDTCRQMILDNATIPSSVDLHNLLGTSSNMVKENGNVVVLIDFDAKNVYGTEIGHTARCIFPPQKAGEIEISLRR